MTQEIPEWERDVADLEKEEREDAARKVQDAKDHEDRVRAVLATEEGRNWVWDLLSDCGIYRVSHIAGDPTHSAFNEGGRNIGLKVLAELREFTPDLYQVMEAQQRTR